MRRVLQLGVAALAAALVSCGGGGGGGGGGVLGTPAFNVVLSAQSALDGYVNLAGTAFTAGSLVIGDSEAPPPATPTRAFVSFDISGIPSGATIQSATLRLYQTGSVGNPLPTHGPLVASHVNYGPTLDSADYAGPTIQFNIGTVTNILGTGWRETSVTNAVQTILGADPRCQFRLEYLTTDANGDGQTQLLIFEDSENTSATGNTPELDVTYVVP